MSEPMTPTGKRLHAQFPVCHLGPHSTDGAECAACCAIKAIEREAAAAERERCIAALRQEGQNVLDSGIRPSEPELSAWNYVGTHFRDNAASVLADPEADR